MHPRQNLRRTQRPTSLQQQVIYILHAKAGELAADIQLVERLLQIDRFDLKRPPLALHGGPQRIGRRAMPAPRVEKQ